MKIEKINRDNIKEFIWDMKLECSDEFNREINKSELYGVKKDNTFYVGFISLSAVDTIAIINYNSKLSNEVFYECIDFLEKSLVVENHLIIDIYNKKYMELLEKKYRCKEIYFSIGLNNSEISVENISSEGKTMHEYIVEIEMKSIKYFRFDDVIICNLLKQNIQDAKIIKDLYDEFVNLGVNYITFISALDSTSYFIDNNYQCMCKSFIIRNDLF